jgi:hypothetical protein
LFFFQLSENVKIDIQKDIIVSNCFIWVRKKEHREQNVERRILGPKRDGIRRGRRIVPFFRYYGADEIKEGEVDSVCNMNGRNEICRESFSWKLLREEIA